MEPERLEVRTPDDRRLDVLVSGHDDTPLVFHHGTPSSLTQLEPMTEAALARGLRLVTYSRPGYGDSDRAEGRSVGDCAADVATILDAVGAHRCLTMGASGGGPHALAAAALLPDRVRAAATIGGCGVHGVDDLDFLTGMGEDNVVEFGMAASGDRDGLARYMEAYRQSAAGTTPEAIVEAIRSLLPPVDVRALTGAMGAHFVEDGRESFRNGVWGWFDDDLAFTRPWGFDLGEIVVPVTIWQGGQDLMVPPAHAAWLASHIPNAKLELRPEQGHLSLIDAFGEILDGSLAVAGL
ncbi:MAG: alpha/beta fold hydrolase [Actinomycetota bacterium]